MAKLTWEWSDPEKNIITIKKPKGKLTMQEIVEFMHQREQANVFEGKLCLIMFRINQDADLYPYDWLSVDGEPTGDAQDVYVYEDGNNCPICGNEMFVQYCPQCGEPLFKGRR